MTTFTKRLPIGIRQKTGETCKESGVWETVSTPSTTAPIAKGNRFPPYRGRSVYWILKYHA